MLLSAVGARQSLQVARDVLESAAVDISSMPDNFAGLVGEEIDGRLAAIFFSGYDPFFSGGEVGRSWRSFVKELQQPYLFGRQCACVQQAVIMQKMRLLRQDAGSSLGCPADEGVMRAIDAFLFEANRIEALLSTLIPTWGSGLFGC